MREVGAFEAKTHLSELLAAVEAGERVRITRRGRAVADLIPVASDAEDRHAAIARLARLRGRLQDALSAEEILDARDAGRR
jgi:prevent-host-death family protein